MNEGENYNLQFSLTTNGTLLTENIVDWLAENKFSLKISLDGKKRINDMNRITTQGYSVHDKVTSNIPLIKRYEKSRVSMLKLQMLSQGIIIYIITNRFVIWWRLVLK